MQAQPVVNQPPSDFHQPSAPPQDTVEVPKLGFNLPEAFSVKLFIAVVAYLLVSIGFILQLAGVGDSNNDCNDDHSYEFCEDVHRSHWWATFFQLIVAIGTALVLLLGVLDAVRIVVAFFLAISTLQLITAAEEFLDGDKDGGPRTAAAGYMFSTMANFLLILVIGVTAKPVMKLPGSQPTTQERVAALTPLQQVPHYLQDQPPQPPPVSSHPTTATD